VTIVATQPVPVILTGLGTVAMVVLGVLLPAVWSKKPRRRADALAVLMALIR
jgi:hypothetical protein